LPYLLHRMLQVQYSTHRQCRLQQYNAYP
jgi:hypothetical protein